jgi:hypothetical protein
MLAQLAPTNPNAQAALLEQAKAGQVSNWNEVEMALTGAHLYFGQDLHGQENSSPNQNSSNRVSMGYEQEDSG